MNDENQIVNINPEDIIEQNPAPKPRATSPTKVSKVGFESKIPPPPDPALVRRDDFDKVMEDARRHQEELEHIRQRVTTSATKYVSILFTPGQIAYLKARIKDDKAAVAEDILVKLESAF
jgi:hypothetical protein